MSGLVGEGGGGVPGPRGGLPQCLVGYHHPSCEQNDKQVQKYYLGHNFVAAGNKFQSFHVDDCTEEFSINYHQLYL